MSTVSRCCSLAFLSQGYAQWLFSPESSASIVSLSLLLTTSPSSPFSSSSSAVSTATALSTSSTGHVVAARSLVLLDQIDYLSLLLFLAIIVRQPERTIASKLSYLLWNSQVFDRVSTDVAFGHSPEPVAFLWWCPEEGVCACMRE